MIGPPLPADDAGFPAIGVAGIDSLGDDVSLPVVRGTHTVHLTDTVSIERGRHFYQGGRRAAALPVRRLQPRVPARAAQLLRRLHWQWHRRPAPGLSDRHAAGDERQPAGAADDGGEPVRPGRLAGDAPADRERRPALRVQHAAGRRRRPHGDLRPGDGDAEAGGAGRRAARRHQRRLEQRRAARRR